MSILIIGVFFLSIAESKTSVTNISNRTRLSSVLQWPLREILRVWALLSNGKRKEVSLFSQVILVFVCALCFSLNIYFKKEEIPNLNMYLGFVVIFVSVMSLKLLYKMREHNLRHFDYLFQHMIEYVFAIWIQTYAIYINKADSLLSNIFLFLNSSIVIFSIWKLNRLLTLKLSDSKMFGMFDNLIYLVFITNFLEVILLKINYLQVTTSVVLSLVITILSYFLLSKIYSMKNKINSNIYIASKYNMVSMSILIALLGWFCV